MHRLPIAKEGSPYIGGLALLLLLFVFQGWSFLAVVTLSAALLVLNFFRDPERAIPAAAQAVVAPADGRIVFLGRVFEDRFLQKEALKISIFMSILDVHVNRIPFSGEIDAVHYEKGKFFSANLDKASRHNEHNAVILRLPEGEKIVLVQIAGLVARRIDCWLRPGDQVRTGERFGIIRFGSRVDLFLPLSSRLVVRKGQRVKAGESVLCYYQKTTPAGENQGRPR